MPEMLICDDEAGLREIIKKYAEFEGFTVTEASDGMEAVRLCLEKDFDIIIMDIMMPELDGFSAVKEIRKHSDVPVIMLSARGEEYDKLHGFDLGIDDYVVKPFSSKEIMRRVSAIMRRVNNPKPGSDKMASGHDIFKKDGFVVDMTAFRVTVDSVQVEMAPKVLDLLFYLIKNRGIAVTRDKLISSVWGYDYCGDDRTLDTHIRLLRQAIQPYGGLIVTLRGVGYRFEG